MREEILGKESRVSLWMVDGNPERLFDHGQSGRKFVSPASFPANEASQSLGSFPFHKSGTRKSKCSIQ
jgi:hypothetical protein